MGGVQWRLRPDIVVFDEDTVGGGELETRADLPGGGLRLYAESTGMSHVLVNGTVIVESGASTGAQPGRLLRSGQDTTTVEVGSLT